ncbi:MAG: hypothetical protein A2600_11185 [Candidatus Lambdaproteobacteria bacterium RIFOXYD1_FULL_56_27]|uniref:ABC transmembrane type-1 domain-containing protein n=1 Tax=Candidatus Lambdaproteobacteria bacterium RIFOXYD2_FULL_56_26 TaxID=1817773 RepID=A0A1F6GU92_9PROT|nr:MAG: hypothetical protein A2426_09225 [Candidatus Lambdaproteobacteria bacterium RIFOXYC1_FULL_56_13]OGH01723.1 MAG: hypothetical protein A2557_09110 [Candidatus Lambdaproteobacteria bacterium RIFOXYD2_FULL_56_26]OGH07608.1 MAG: hypothetical protein A2600_11185 [Candidatus Lambdaproteobacteria bacterium RIFOXYD1_FULL_56_27]
MALFFYLKPNPVPPLSDRPHRPQLNRKGFFHPLVLLCWVGFLPFVFSLFSPLPGHGFKLGLVILAMTGLGYLVFQVKRNLLWAVLLVLPIYGFTCLGYADPDFYLQAAASSGFERVLGPSSELWLGSDYEGRDILATLVLGGKNAYTVGLYCCLTALALGIPFGLGLTSNSPWIKNPSFWVVQFYEIVPQIFFVLIVLGVYNFWAAESAGERLTESYSLPIAGIAIGLSSLPAIARIIENRILLLKSERFVLALESSNVSRTKVLLYNLLWKNCTAEILIQTTFLFGSALLLESALSFAFEIGFGDLGTGGYQSWGKLLAEARRSILFGENGWIVLPPIVATLLSIMGVNALGQRLAQSSSGSEES